MIQRVSSSIIWMLCEISTVHVKRYNWMGSWKYSLQDFCDYWRCFQLFFPASIWICLDFIHSYSEELLLKHFREKSVQEIVNNFNLESFLFSRILFNISFKDYSCNAIFPNITRVISKAEYSWHLQKFIKGFKTVNTAVIILVIPPIIPTHF